MSIAKAKTKVKASADHANGLPFFSRRKIGKCALLLLPVRPQEPLQLVQLASLPARPQEPLQLVQLASFSIKPLGIFGFGSIFGAVFTIVLRFAHFRESVTTRTCVRLHSQSLPRPHSYYTNMCVSQAL